MACSMNKISIDIIITRFTKAEGMKGIIEIDVHHSIYRMKGWVILLSS